MVTEEAVIQKKLHGSSQVFSLFTGPLGMVDDPLSLSDGGQPSLSRDC